MRRISVIRTVVFISFVAVLAGCAASRERVARNKVDLMVASGFVPKVAQTPQEKAQLESMTPLRMHSYLNNSTFTYVFPDPKGCNCVYVGNQTQYAAYRHLAIQKEISENNAQASQWNYGYPPYWGWGGWGAPGVFPHDSAEEEHEEHEHGNER